jgi:hypothetical protein
MCTVRSKNHDEFGCDLRGVGPQGCEASSLRRLCLEGAFRPAVVRAAERLGALADLNGEPVSGDALADLLTQGAIVRG